MYTEPVFLLCFCQLLVLHSVFGFFLKASFDNCNLISKVFFLSLAINIGFQKRKACLPIYLQSLLLYPASPDCEFEEDMCDWEAQEGWVLDKRKRVEGFEKSGKMVLLCAVLRNVVLIS